MSRERIADVRSERDYWRKIAEEGLEPRIKSMTYGQEGFDIALTGEVCQAMAAAFVSHFKACGATNYLEMNLHEREEPFQRYIVTVQKVGGKSPADKLRDAEATIAELRLKTGLAQTP